MSSIPDNFASHKDQIDYVSTTLKSGRLDQSMVMKLFLTEDIHPYLDEIIDTLKLLKFKFIVIKRENLEHHLLSHIIAKESNKWNSTEGLHNTDTFTITDFESVVWMQMQITNFNNIVNKLDIEYATVRYEHALDDLTSVLRKEINTDIDVEKQMSNKHIEIIRFDNAKIHIKEYLNGEPLANTLTYQPAILKMTGARLLVINPDNKEEYYDCRYDDCTIKRING